jgi:5'-methylthioadenosine phosphorylase
MKIGLIGGSGLYDIEGLEIKGDVSISTPYGYPSSAYKVATLNGKELFFLQRHGIPHRIPPHKINYRANIWGFKSLGVERIIAINAVGGINSSYRPGDIVVVDQIIDMTFGSRASTFYEEGDVYHIDFTYPYCSEMRETFIKASEDLMLPVKRAGTYICVSGPRLETAKEIEFFSNIGADVVGMTAMPEASLARELEMCLCGLSIVTNYAAGISKERLTTTEVVNTMEGSIGKLKLLLKEFLSLIPQSRSCSCKDALRDAKI